MSSQDHSWVFCAACLWSCSLTQSLSLQVEDAQPTGDGDIPELLAASMEQGLRDSSVSSSGEDASDTDSGDGDAQKPPACESSGDGSGQEQEADHESSSLLQHEVRTLLA